MLKAVIVDDEPKAIQSLNWELSNFSEDIQVVKTFSDPEKSTGKIAISNDILFLLIIF